MKLGYYSIVTYTWPLHRRDSAPVGVLLVVPEEGVKEARFLESFQHLRLRFGTSFHTEHVQSQVQTVRAWIGYEPNDLSVEGWDAFAGRLGNETEMTPMRAIRWPAGGSAEEEIVRLFEDLVAPPAGVLPEGGAEALLAAENDRLMDRVEALLHEDSNWNRFARACVRSHTLSADKMRETIFNMIEAQRADPAEAEGYRKRVEAFRQWAYRLVDGRDRHTDSELMERVGSLSKEWEDWAEGHVPAGPGFNRDVLDVILEGKHDALASCRELEEVRNQMYAENLAAENWRRMASSMLGCEPHGPLAPSDDEMRTQVRLCVDQSTSGPTVALWRDRAQDSGRRVVEEVGKTRAWIQWARDLVGDTEGLLSPEELQARIEAKL